MKLQLCSGGFGGAKVETLDSRGVSWEEWRYMCKTKGDARMNFRELKAFSFAFLEKQCWRTLNNPNSLVARVLKCKYHAHAKF